MGIIWQEIVNVVKGRVLTERLNFVFILTDDQGPWALGCAGNPEIITPNLDQLAKEGVRFDRFFATSPVCSPARASLLTGLVPSQHGVHDFIRDGHISSTRIEYLARHRAITKYLADVGYECALTGKWHLGSSDVPQQGFSHWYALEGGSSDYNYAKMYRGSVLVEERGYLTDVIADEGVRFLRTRAGDAPFYLAVNFTAPHHPWIGQHPADLLAMYNDCEFESCPQERPYHPWGPSSLYAENRAAVRNPRPNLQGYFAAVTGMDRAVGRIVDTLKELKLMGSTVVIFTSDNGYNCGHHGFWGKGNGTFPQNMYEESVRVPLIVYHPDSQDRGIVVDDLINGYDVFPTLAEMAGIVVNEESCELYPGLSFRELILGGGGKPTRNHVVVYSEYGPVRMIRSDSWKLIVRYPFGPNELYDLSEDPRERVNRLGDGGLAARQEEELTRTLDAWFSRYSDPYRDGSRMPVTGIGQRQLVGEGYCARQAFYPPEWYDFPVHNLQRFPAADYPGSRTHDVK